MGAHINTVVTAQCLFSALPEEKEMQAFSMLLQPSCDFFLLFEIGHCAAQVGLKFAM